MMSYIAVNSNVLIHCTIFIHVIIIINKNNIDDDEECHLVRNLYVVGRNSAVVNPSSDFSAMRDQSIKYCNYGGPNPLTFQK